jgi:hypothetical protein
MSRVGVVGVVLLGAAFAGCGSTGRGSAEQRITIGAIAQRTLDAKTARIEAAVRVTDPTPPTVLRASGTARFDPERYSVVLHAPHIGTIQELILTHDAFVRYPAPGPEFAGALPKGWCKENGGVAEHGFGFNPTSALTSLRSGGGTLQQLGTERVRGVDTTHFRVVKAGLPPTTEVWVDSNDLLRRIQQTKVGEVDVLDFFDYGVATPPIAAPPRAKPCPGP